MKFLIGRKIETSQIFDEKGNFVPVVFIEAGPCKVLQIKSKERDGYKAFQLGYNAAKPKAIKKTMKGKEFRYLREFRPKNNGNEEQLKEGDWINVSMFAPGDKVKVSGVSKGKGTQGAVKRWGFHGKNATHGQKHEKRTLGSTGTSFPQRVIKGKKMSGRMGAERVSAKNLKVVQIDSEKNILTVKGAVPGKNGAILEITG